MVGRYEGSIADALIDLYPEVKFEKSKFSFKVALYASPSSLPSSSSFSFLLLLLFFHFSPFSSLLLAPNSIL